MTYSPGISEDASGQQHYDLDNGSVSVGRAGGSHQTPFTDNEETGERTYFIEEQDLQQDADYKPDPEAQYLEAVMEAFPDILQARDWAAEALSPEFIADFNNALNEGGQDDYMPFIEQLMEEFHAAHATEEPVIEQSEIDEAIETLQAVEPGGTETAMEWMQLAVSSQENDPILSEAAHLTAQVHRGELNSSEAIQRMVDKHPMAQLQRVYRAMTSN